MKTRTRSINTIWTASLAIFLLAGGATAFAEEESEVRLSTTSQGQGIQRGAGAGSVSKDEFKPLIKRGDRKASTRSSGQQKLGAGQSSSANTDFWFYDADVVLYSDLDRDGYYAGIDLEFDADTVFVAADVYAVIYLSYEQGPWNEYASTADFSIFGASSDDKYVVETDLVSGYPTGDYDILIELFDTLDGAFVASFGPEDSSELSLLPLEDAARDTPPDTIVVVESGGGSLGVLALFALLGFAGYRHLVAAGRAHDFSAPRCKAVEVDVQGGNHQQ